MFLIKTAKRGRMKSLYLVDRIHHRAVWSHDIADAVRFESFETAKHVQSLLYKSHIFLVSPSGLFRVFSKSE